MKKLLSAVLCLAMLSTSAVAMAQDNSKIKVVVDDKLVVFPDQEPVITPESRTLIPVRGVLEAMGATVEWNQEEKSVYVKSNDGIRRLKLFIDNNVMKKYTVKSVMVVDQEDVTLEVPPTIINGRTMIPLRVVSENIDAIVNWIQADKLIDITTKEYQAFQKKAVSDTDATEFEAKNYVPRLYLGDVTTDDEYTYVDVNVENANLLEGSNKFGGMTLTINYDPEKVSIEDIEMVDNDKNKADAFVNTVNPNYTATQAKYVGVVKPCDEFADEIDFVDGTIARIKLSRVAEGETSISIANFVDNIGASTTILTKQDVVKTNELNNAKELLVDTSTLTLK